MRRPWWPALPLLGILASCQQPTNLSVEAPGLHFAITALAVQASPTPSPLVVSPSPTPAPTATPTPTPVAAPTAMPTPVHLVSGEGFSGDSGGGGAPVPPPSGILVVPHDGGFVDPAATETAVIGP